MNRLLRTALIVACLAATARAAEEVPTVITSDQAELVSTDTEATFTFRDHVVVTGTDLKLTCDLLVVVANRTGDQKATIGKPDKFKSLVATGNVRILQGDREATCERAEVFPAEEKVVLSGTPLPRVRTLNDDYAATGEIIELHRGERRVIIPARTHITLPAIKDLGFDKEKKAPATPAGPAPKQ